MEDRGQGEGALGGAQGLVIAREVAGQDATQVALAENKNVIQALASHRAGEPLGNGILPRALRRREDFRDAHALDFFLVPTLTFRLLFVFVVLRHHRRELIHINVTDHPTAAWTARQIVEAFPDDAAPLYLLRDRDRIYGAARRVARMGIREVLIASSAPWQNPFVERVIGSIRRECLHHFLVLTSGTSTGSCGPTGSTTTPRAHIKRWTRTAHTHGTASPLASVGSWRFRISADSITGTSAPPDTRRPADLTGPRLGLLGQCRSHYGPPALPLAVRARFAPWTSAQLGAAEVSDRHSLNEEFRRRVKTQGALPTDDAAVTLLFSLVASGQIKLRRLDGWRRLAAVIRQRLRPAA